jgi:hypothetical protein
METPALKLISVMRKLLEDEKIDETYKSEISSVMPCFFFFFFFIINIILF